MSEWTNLLDANAQLAYQASELRAALDAKEARIAELSELLRDAAPVLTNQGYFMLRDRIEKALAAQPSPEPLAASQGEEGREVTEVVGIVTASGMRRGVNSVVSRPPLHDLRPGDALMTVAQHERILRQVLGGLADD